MQGYANFLLVSMKWGYLQVNDANMPEKKQI
jgi:hypothetical protein